MNRENIKIFFNTKNQKLEEGIISYLSTIDVIKYFEFDFDSFYFSQNKENLMNQTQKEISLYEKTFEYDKFFYDLNSCDLENLKFHLRMFQNLDLKKPKQLILLSNILTWEKTINSEKKTDEENQSVINDIIEQKKLSNFQNSNQENQEEINEEILEENEEQIQQEIEESEDEEENKEKNEENENSNQEILEILENQLFNNKDFYCRKSRDDFLEFIQIENLALNLNQNKINFQVNVICPGIIYGMGEQNLFEIFKQSWLQEPQYLNYIENIDENNINLFHHLCKKPISFIQKKSFLQELKNEEQNQEEQNQDQEEENENEKQEVIKKKQIQLNGNNQIPMIHQKDLFLFIKYILLEDCNQWNYVIAIDYNRKRRQKQIIKAITKGINSGIYSGQSYNDVQYDDLKKRLLCLNLQFEYTKLFDQKKIEYQKYQKILQEIKEREEQLKEQEEQEKQQEQDQEEIQQEEQELTEEQIEEQKIFEEKQNYVKNYKDIQYNWHCKNGISMEIEKIKEEFIKQHNLKPNKICIIGEPYSGKSKIAKQLANKYKLQILTKDYLIEKYSQKEDELGEKIRSFVDEKKNEILEKNLEEIEKAKIKQKKNKPKLLQLDDIKVKLSDQIYIEIIKTELNLNLYLNRGYILDGVLENYYQAFKLFKMQKIIYNEDGEIENEENEEDEEIPEEKLKFMNLNKSNLILNEKIAPTCIIQIETEDINRNFFLVNQNKENQQEIQYENELQYWNDQNKNDQVLSMQQFFEDEKFQFLKIKNKFNQNITPEIESFIDSLENRNNFYENKTQEIPKQNEIQNDCEKENENQNIQEQIEKRQRQLLQREIGFREKELIDYEFYEDNQFNNNVIKKFINMFHRISCNNKRQNLSRLFSRIKSILNQNFIYKSC